MIYHYTLDKTELAALRNNVRYFAGAWCRAKRLADGRFDVTTNYRMEGAK